MNKLSVAKQLMAWYSEFPTWYPVLLGVFIAVIVSILNGVFAFGMTSGERFIIDVILVIVYWVKVHSRIQSFVDKN